MDSPEELVQVLTKALKDTQRRVKELETQLSQHQELNSNAEHQTTGSKRKRLLESPPSNENDRDGLTESDSEQHSPRTIKKLPKNLTKPEDSMMKILRKVREEVSQMRVCDKRRKDFPIIGPSFVDEQHFTSYFKRATPKKRLATLKWFYWPGLLESCGQHYIVYGPKRQTEGDFKVISCFKTLEGETRPLFVQDVSGLHYMGEYQLRRIKDAPPNGYTLPIPGADVSAKTIARYALPQSQGSSSLKSLEDLYHRGILQVECASLQYMSFDGDLFSCFRKIYVSDFEAGIYGSESLNDERVKKRVKAA